MGERVCEGICGMHACLFVCVPYNMLTCVFSYCRSAAAVLGALFLGRFALRELCTILSGFRAFFLAPLGLGGGANLCKHGNWAGKYMSWKENNGFVDSVPSQFLLVLYKDSI